MGGERLCVHYEHPAEQSDSPSILSSPSFPSVLPSFLRSRHISMHGEPILGVEESSTTHGLRVEYIHQSLV